MISLFYELFGQVSLCFCFYNNLFEKNNQDTSLEKYCSESDQVIKDVG